MNNLTDTFQISNRINVYLLKALHEGWLTDIATSKGRTVGEQFAHIHNVRLMWLKEAAPEFMKLTDKIEKEDISKKTLSTQLDKSALAISRLIEKGLAEKKIKGFKPHPEAFVGYIIAHEAHHRGQIMTILKENGHLTDKSLGFALWQWGTR